MSYAKLIQTFPTLDLKRIFTLSLDDDPVLSRESVRFYASGRAALFQIVKSLTLPPGSTILLPSYHCGVEVEAVLRAGCKVEFYRVKRDLSIDLQHLCQKITATTRGIVIAHFYGFSQKLSEIKDLCCRKGIVLIEDCAHALYSQSQQGNWLGTEGDLGLFSMRKTVFMPNGGAVRVNRNGLALPDKGKNYFNLSLLKTTVRSVLEHQAWKSGVIPDFSRWLLERHRKQSSQADGIQDLHPNQDTRWYYDVPMLAYEHDISAVSLVCTGNEQFQTIINRRRKNYLALEKLLLPRLVDRFVFPELPKGVCPLCFPLFVNQRDRIAASLTDSGVIPFVFAKIPHPLLNEAEFPELKTLADEIIGLPIHQQLTEQDMAVVADALYRSLER